MAQNKSDLNQIEELLDEKLTKLRSDFFEKVDPILMEVTTARLEKLEKIHAEGKHVPAS